MRHQVEGNLMVPCRPISCDYILVAIFVPRSKYRLSLAFSTLSRTPIHMVKATIRAFLANHV